MGLYLKNIVFSLGTLYMHTLNNYYDEKYEELESLNGSYCTAIVVSEGEEKDYKDVYEIEIKGIKLLLNLKKSKNKSLQNKENRYLSNKNSKNSSFKLKYGDKIEFYLEYEKPSTARNYMGFDYSNYLKTKKIFGTVNLKEEDVEIISHDNSNIILRKIYELRNLMKTKIEKLLPKETSGLCLGMLIGETSGIEENMQEDFRDSNLSHILAVSGANVSYIIVSITYIFNKMCLRKRLSKIISIILLILFMLLTGCTSSVNRACIMAILMLIAELLYRKSDVYNNLAISALILLIINPYSLLDIGFQLSYMGTIGIVFLHDKIGNFIKINNKIVKYFFEMIAVTTCANLAIIPIMMFHFNTISLTFYFSNIIVGPILGIVVIIGFIMFFISLIFTPISSLIAIVLNLMLKFIIKIAEITANMPFSKITIITPSFFFIIVWYLIIISISYKQKVKIFYHKNNKLIKKIVSCILIIVLIVNLIIKVDKKLEIHFVDVGQGDACLIITPLNKKILIDGGGSEFGSFNVGEKTLLPYLLDRRINKLDYIIISHFDSDHVRFYSIFAKRNKSKKYNNRETV
ncbi:MAG: ComEC/Rec2 family competence protein [Clostridia bacterium]|jgi:ComEC/Rec2-like protein